ncbi:MAG: sigma factor, partial [Bacteroidota bacterium]
MKKVYSRNEITDDQLMNMIQRSDETAFNILYGRYWKALYSFAFSILNDEDVSKDIVQVIWIKFWESRKKIKNQNIRSYLLKMVQNGVYKHLRDNKKFGDRLQLIDDYFSTQ